MHRRTEGVEPLAAARLARAIRRAGRSAVAVADQVVDEQVDARDVVEQHACPSPASASALSKKTHGTPARGRRARRSVPRSIPTVESSSPSTRWASSVRSARDLAVGGLLAVHQHHAVARLLERALRALERGGVERARDVGNDEPDREASCASAASGRGATAGSGGRPRPRARRRGSRPESSPRPFSARDAVDAETPAYSATSASVTVPTVPQTVAQAIATLS